MRWENPEPDTTTLLIVTDERFAMVTTGEREQPDSAAVTAIRVNGVKRMVYKVA